MSFEQALLSRAECNLSDPCLKKTSAKRNETSLLNSEHSVDSGPNLANVIEITKYQDIQKLLRVTCNVAKFLHYNVKYPSFSDKEVTLDDMLKLWIVSEQQADHKENLEMIFSL